MDQLLTKAKAVQQKFRDKKTQYTIKAEKLSYWLYHHGGFQVWKKATGTKCILKNVSCEARPGEIMAIAGPSGAGKTTLLNVLAGMIPLSRVCGNVVVNNQPMVPTQFRRVSGYVTQDDTLFPLLTVEETLMYSARLRLHGGYRKAEARGRKLLKQLGLEHVAKERIGGESQSSRGISGGEKRRISIGIDLVHNPAVVLIDEPTSGLDSASALDIALLLKSMAMKQRKTIVLTIHQPSFRILELFDRILLLSSNGTVVHHGSLHLLKLRLRFAGHSIPRHVNVLEFAIEMAQTLVVNNNEGEDQDAADVEQGGGGCDEEEEEEEDDIHIRGRRRRNSNKQEQQLDNNVKKLAYANHQLKEVVILSQRFSNNIFRTKELFLARTLQALLAGIVLGTIFMNAANDHSTTKFKVETQIGFFAFSLTFLLSATSEGLPIYLQERRILMRETSRGAYRISSYVISNTMVFLPFLLIVALLYAVPVYWLVGLRTQTYAFLYFSLLVWMVLLMSNSFVACFSALVPNFIMGTSLIAALLGSFFLFSGYFIAKQDIPNYWIFMHYLSLFKYPFECFMINEYGGENSSNRCLTITQGHCILNAQQLLSQKGLKESQKWTNIAVMFSFIIGYRFLSFLILSYRSYRTKG